MRRVYHDNDNDNDRADHDNRDTDPGDSRQACRALLPLRGRASYDDRMSESPHPLAVRLGERLGAAGLMLACAESCTGGWISKLVTDVPGSSAWLDRGFVTYSNQAKQDLLGVRAETLERHGAVSEAVVREMAAGALARSRAQLAVAVSGVAGPGGGTSDKPVGTVWLAWARAGQGIVARRVQLPGDRDDVRRATAELALAGLIELSDGGA